MTKCKKCGVEHVNQAAEFFGGDDWYCDTCYSKRAEDHRQALAKEKYDDVYLAMAGDEFALTRLRQGGLVEINTLGDLDRIGREAFKAMGQENRDRDLAELLKIYG